MDGVTDDWLAWIAGDIDVPFSNIAVLLHGKVAGKMDTTLQAL